MNGRLIFAAAAILLACVAGVGRMLTAPAPPSPPRPHIPEWNGESRRPVAELPPAAADVSPDTESAAAGPAAAPEEAGPALARPEDFPPGLTIAEVRPQRFSASLEGFGGPSYSVRMMADGSLLEYLSNPRGFIARPETRRTVVSVTPQQWAAFRRNLETAQFQTWDANYKNDRVVDGTVWKVEAAWPEGRGASGGRNAYPDAKQFAIFKAAVAQLAGREFR